MPEDSEAARLETQIAEIEAQIAARENTVIAAFEQTPGADQWPIAGQVRALLAAGDHRQLEAVTREEAKSHQMNAG